MNGRSVCQQAGAECLPLCIVLMEADFEFLEELALFCQIGPAKIWLIIVVVDSCHLHHAAVNITPGPPHNDLPIVPRAVIGVSMEEH